MKLLPIPLLVFSLITPLNADTQVNNKPDQIVTEGGHLVIHPVLHGSIVFEWNDLDIYVDPYGGQEHFTDYRNPDLILITHLHDDHFNLETLMALNTNQTTFVVPESVAEEMPDIYSDQSIILSNGERIDIKGISVEAVPMYNLPEEGARHPKGWGNGYILGIGRKNIYVSGDTEDIPEMRNLNNIDVAFVCMNLPYTMDIQQAASAVLDFKPEIVYPYHHRGQDIEQFKSLVHSGNQDIEVRLKDWYQGN